MENKLANVVRKYFKAYELKDRRAIELLLTDNFTFSSPVDDNINRKTYFNRCWPSCKYVESYDIQHLVVDGSNAFVKYECKLKSGASFQNMEHFSFEGNQIKDIDVYFGFEPREDSVLHMKVKELSEAFAKGNMDYIMDHVTENISWHFVGERYLHGKEAVRELLEPMRGVAASEYRTKNIMLYRNKAVVEGTMKMPSEDSYAFCDVYTFDEVQHDKLAQLSAYIMKISDEEL